jgi:hypothetical protein
MPHQPQGLLRFDRIALAVALAVATGSPASAQVAACRVADATITTALDSRDTRPRSVFRFTIAGDDPSSSGSGYGVVDFVRGAKRGGVPGEIGIETRFVQLADGTHVPATILADASAASVFHGSTRNSPFILNALGLAKGRGFKDVAVAIGVYNFIHSGSQASVPAGTPLKLVLGDDYLTGACAVP